MKIDAIKPIFTHEARQSAAFDAAQSAANDDSYAGQFNSQSSGHGALNNDKKFSPFSAIISLVKNGEHSQAIRVLKNNYSEGLFNRVMDSLEEMKKHDKHHPALNDFEREFDPGTRSEARYERSQRLLVPAPAAA